MATMAGANRAFSEAAGSITSQGLVTGREPGSELPLSDVVVIDFGRILAGAECALDLRQAGARVIKIESPAVFNDKGKRVGGGDDTRYWGPPWIPDEDGKPSTDAAYFAALNGGKESVAINLKDPQGPEIVKDLIRGFREQGKTIVVVENFKPGVTNKLGIDYDSLKAEFPEIIYGSISGYDRFGENGNRPGFDFAAQAKGGLIAITGERFGSSICDIVAGRSLASGIKEEVADVKRQKLRSAEQIINKQKQILDGYLSGRQPSGDDLEELAALRQETPKGRYLYTDLMAAAISLHVNLWTYAQMTGKEPPVVKGGHPTIVPYSIVKTSDSEMVIAIGNNKLFRDFSAKLDRVYDAHAAELNWPAEDKPCNWAQDERFRENALRCANREALMGRIEELMRLETKHFWLDILGNEPGAVPCDSVNGLLEVMKDPEFNMHLVHMKRGNVDITMPSEPIKFAGMVTELSPPPRLGEHTRAVLSEFYSPEKLEDLLQRGVVQDEQAASVPAYAPPKPQGPAEPGL